MAFASGGHNRVPAGPDPHRHRCPSRHAYIGADRHTDAHHDPNRDNHTHAGADGHEHPCTGPNGNEDPYAGTDGHENAHTAPRGDKYPHAGTHRHEYANPSNLRDLRSRGAEIGFMQCRDMSFRGDCNQPGPGDLQRTDHSGRSDKPTLVHAAGRRCQSLLPFLLLHVCRRPGLSGALREPEPRQQLSVFF